MGDKILLFDIETAPNLSFVWARYEQNVIENVRDWYMLCFSYKWLGQKRVHAYSLPDFPRYRRHKDDDTSLVEELWKLFSQADIVVAHNGAEFDVKKSNARFLIDGLKPPSPYKIIDTKIIAKRYFKFDSNSLKELARQLGLGEKQDTGGFELWRGCMEGKSSAWKKMVSYNKQDIRILEEVYLKMRPWIKTFPIVRADNGTCRNCNAFSLQRRGFSYTAKFKIQRLQCQHCGAWQQGDKEKL